MRNRSLTKVRLNMLSGWQKMRITWPMVVLIYLNA